MQRKSYTMDTSWKYVGEGGWEVIDGVGMHGKITTRTFKKALNKYLYIPQQVPVHPASVSSFSWSAKKHNLWKHPSILVSKLQHRRLQDTSQEIHCATYSSRPYPNRYYSYFQGCFQCSCQWLDPTHHQQLHPNRYSFSMVNTILEVFHNVNWFVMLAALTSLLLHILTSLLLCQQVYCCCVFSRPQNLRETATL